MKILNSKFDAKCKACGTFINAGDSVRWSKADGVSWTTCMACPHEPKAKGTTPANGTPATPITSAVMAALVTERDELLQRLALAREAFREQRSEIETLRTALTEARSVITQTANERDELRAQLRNLAEGPLRFVDVPSITPTPDADDDCPI